MSTKEQSATPRERADAIVNSTPLAPDGQTELREGYAEVGDVKLHYVEAGAGPLIVLLHGFPEFWFGWRLQITPLAAAGFRVVAPDMRGYNLSSRPAGVAAYTADRLAILNAAHPRRLQQGLRTPRQLLRSWYFFYFQLPGTDRRVRARGWRFFRHFLRDARPAYTPEDIERYVEAWSQPGAAAAMINYYRAAVRQSPKDAGAQLRPISAPTLVIWG